MEWDAETEFLASHTKSQMEETALPGFQPELVKRNRASEGEHFPWKDEVLVQIILYSSTEKLKYKYCTVPNYPKGERGRLL